MRLSQTPPSLLSLLLLLLQTNSCQAGPYPKDNLHDLGFSYLQDRDCASYCGTDNQYCCTAGQACYTNAADIAYCSAGVAASATGGGGGYAVYTTTWTETDVATHTSTWSSALPIFTSTFIAPVVTATAGPPICTTSLGESSCGNICCASFQRCAFANSCTAYSSSYVATVTAVGTSTYSAPVRPTSGGVSTRTSTATTTQPFIPPATASGSSLPITSGSSNHGLSGGAIAGIVIGVIAGIILLLLICFCCIVKAGFDGLLALFGLGKKRRSRETVITEERYSRHGSGTASRRDTHTGWFGGSRPARVDEKRKESSGFGGLGMVGAGLLGLAAILGLKRREERKKTTTVIAGRSDISSSYYTDSYTGTSASSASSDRRTRETRRSSRR